MFKTETELQLELFPRNWTEIETEIMPGTEISLRHWTQQLWQWWHRGEPSYNARVPKIGKRDENCTWNVRHHVLVINSPRNNSWILYFQKVAITLDSDKSWSPYPI